MMDVAEERGVLFGGSGVWNDVMTYWCRAG